jgi:4-amino-4-deoxy-L-arabinose transferase-like glycosyltransferase
MTALRALLVASAILLFVDLGGSTIWDANEAFYVETPRQMVLTGDYVNPSFNGEPRFNKPVLSYWVVAGFYKVMGVGVTAERVAIAFGALMLIVATFVIGRTLGGRNAGVIAALVVASAPAVMLWSRRIFIDVWLTAFLALALMWYVLAEGYPHRRRLSLVGMYVAIGLAMLTKGPVAIALPGLALLIHLVMTRTLRDLRVMLVPLGLVIIAAIVAPWYIADYHQHGWEHIKAFFIGENFDRYTETVGFQNRGPLFYIPVLLGDLTPWSLFLPAAVWLAWRERRPDLRLMIIWIAVFAGVFSLSKTKQDLYIFPAAPAIAALIGVLISRSIDAAAGARKDGVEWLARAGAVATALLLTAAGALAVYLSGLTSDIPNLKPLAVAGAVLAAGGALAGILAFRARLLTVAIALGTTAVVVNWLLVLLVMRPFEAFKPVAPMSAWLREHADGAVVAHYKTTFASMTYYLGRPVTQVFDIESMTALIDREPRLYVMARPGEIAEIISRNAVPVCVVSKRKLPVFDAKLSEITSGKLPEIWLAGIKGACK